LASWQAYFEYGLGVTADDTFWSAADPGWAYGLYTAIAAPLAAGRTTLLVAGGFTPESTWNVLSQHQVTNFTAAPTVYRSLRTSSAPTPGTLQLRRASSAGEPLTPEVNEWAASALGLLVHDHFGQTEVGMVLANHHDGALARPMKPRSMGRPGPGWALTILDRDADIPATVGEPGRLAIDIEASPLMTFQAYQVGDETGPRFTADRRFYLTGDTARIDSDGDYYFSARDDDVIIMAGYRIGPSDVEAVLAQHPAVAECCVTSVPDALRGEVIEAFVVLRTEHPAFPKLACSLQQLVKTRYAAHAYPRTVHFVTELPKTPSGKIQRFKLRQQRPISDELS
jgi:acetyl-CoA synthetase